MKLILFGPPAAGKGTQSGLLQSRRGYIQLSTGEMLRKARQSGTELGKQVAAIMDEGKLVPDPVVIKLIDAFLDRDDEAPGYIFDGFPRNIQQAEALDRLLSGRDAAVDLVVSLRVDDAALLKRVIGRQAEEGRQDDDPEILKQRLATYREQTEPLLDLYEKRGILHWVDGMAPVEQVYAELEGVLRQSQKFV